MSAERNDLPALPCIYCACKFWAIYRKQIVVPPIITRPSTRTHVRPIGPRKCRQVTASRDPIRADATPSESSSKQPFLKSLAPTLITTIANKSFCESFVGLSSRPPPRAHRCAGVFFIREQRWGTLEVSVKYILPDIQGSQRGNCCFVIFSVLQIENAFLRFCVVE